MLNSTYGKGYFLILNIFLFLKLTPKDLNAAHMSDLSSTNCSYFCYNFGQRATTKLPSNELKGKTSSGDFESRNDCNQCMTF